jgi:FkbM family methyltransferase
MPVRYVARLYMLLFGRKVFYRWNEFLVTVGARGMCVSDPMMSAIGPPERTFLGRFARLPNPVVFDVGANVGQYSAELKRLCPGARISAFEPHPASFRHLADEAAQSGFTAVNLGLSDQRGRRSLYDYATAPGSPHASLHREVIETVHRADSIAIDINVTTVDDLLAGPETEHLDLLKIDAEGHELAIIRGASNAIASKRIDIVQFEFNEMNVVNRVFLRDFYDELGGYSLYRMVVDGLAPLGPYRARTHELFFGHNILAIRDGLSYADALR